MVTLRHSIAELTRALCVLALLFLNFGHVAPAAHQGSEGVYTVAAVSLSFCGEPMEQPGEHAPCHACRIAGVSLPPPPCVANPAFVAAPAIFHPPADAPRVRALPLFDGDPRGPPVAV